MKNHLDIKYDLYRNVHKIKYEDEDFDPDEIDSILRKKDIMYEQEKRKIWHELKI